jgi:uncharacterized protein
MQLRIRRLGVRVPPSAQENPQARASISSWLRSRSSRRTRFCHGFCHQRVSRGPEDLTERGAHGGEVGRRVRVGGAVDGDRVAEPRGPQCQPSRLAFSAGRFCPVLSGVWVEAVALVAAFVIAVVTTPAGVSGAVLLLPFQVSVLGTPSPSVTPTNLLYNVVACPGAMWRYRRQGQTGGSLTWLLLAGTLPGVIAGSVIRVYLLPGAVVFDFVVAAVMIPLGGFLLLTPATPAGTDRQPRLHRLVIGMIAAAAGCVGGIYGIGGGSILAPILITDGQPPSLVAPAALSSTFVTSLAGVVTFSILSANQHGSVAPNWPTGIALGIGGLAGGYVGARLHARMPETIIRRLLALVVIAIGIRYLVGGFTGGA